MSYGASFPGLIMVSVPGYVHFPRRLNLFAWSELYYDHSLLCLPTVYKVLDTAPQRLMFWVHLGSLCFLPGHWKHKSWWRAVWLQAQILWEISQAAPQAMTTALLVRPHGWKLPSPYHFVYRLCTAVFEGVAVEEPAPLHRTHSYMHLHS